MSSERRRIVVFILLLLCAPIPLLAAPAKTPATVAAAAPERGDVTITTTEYRRLLEAVEPRGGPAAEVSFGEARFRVTIEGESAVFEESFRAETRASGWVSSAFVRASLDRASIAPADRAFFFVSREVSRLALFGPGSASGQFVARSAATPGADAGRSLRFLLPLIPVQRGRVELPGKNLEVSVNGGEILSRSELRDETVLEVAGHAGAALTVSFRPKDVAESKASAPLSVSAIVYARFEIVGSNLVTDVFARLIPTAGRISAVEFALPAGSKMLFLRGPGLLAADTSADRIRAARVSPSPEPLEAQMRLTRAVDETVPFALPLPRLLVPGSVDVYVDFRAPQGALAETVEAAGFESMDVKDLPAALQALGAEAEEILHLAASTADARPPLVRLHRLDAAPVLTAQVRVVRGRSVVSRSGRALSRIEYEVISSVKPFLTIHLPEGGTFWGAEASGRPILPAMPEKGSIAIPLKTGRRRLARVIAYVLSPVEMPRGRGTLIFQPPSADIPISRLEWSFSLPSGADYRIEGSDYREAESIELAAQGAEKDQAASELAQRAQLALGKETRAAGRDPIVPRMPDAPQTVALRTELPSAALRPVKLEVRPRGGSEVWQ